MYTKSRRRFSTVKAFFLCSFAYFSLFAAASPYEFDVEEQEAEVERLIVQSNLENDIEEVKKEGMKTPLNGEPVMPTPEIPCAIYPKCCTLGGCP